MEYMRGHFGAKPGVTPRTWIGHGWWFVYQEKRLAYRETEKKDYPSEEEATRIAKEGCLNEPASPPQHESHLTDDS